MPITWQVGRRWQCNRWSPQVAASGYAEYSIDVSAMDSNQGEASMRTGYLHIDLQVPFNHEGQCEEDDPEMIDRVGVAVEDITWKELKPVAGKPGSFEYKCTSRPLYVTVHEQRDGSFSVDTDLPAHVAENTLRNDGWLARLSRTLRRLMLH